MKALDLLRRFWLRDAPDRTAPTESQRAFGGPWLSPGTPRAPMFPTAYPRYYDYTSGVNYDSTPRSEYPGVPSFSHLWAFSKAATTARVCITFVARQMAGLPWEIRGRKEFGEVDALRVRRASRLFERPDVQNGWNFEQWFLASMEEILVTDAWTICPVRSRDGGVAELMLVDGQTIKPMHSYTTGGRPLPPDIAYQQYITGIPYSGFTTDDLLYMPTRPRINCTYGLSHLEAVYLLATGAVMYENYWMQYFKDGNIPEVAALADTTLYGNMSPEEFRRWQEAQDKVSGFTTKKRRVHLMPPFIRDVKPVKEFTFEQTLPQWNARSFCIEFGVPFHLFVSDTNRSTAHEVNEVMVEMPFRQKLMMFKRMFDEILERAGYPELEWVWRQPPDYRREAVDGIVMMVQNGVMSPEEARRELGIEEGDSPYDMEKPEGDNADPRAPQTPATGTAPERLGFDRMPKMATVQRAAKRLRVNPAKLGGPERMKRALAVDLLYKPALRKLDLLRKEEIRKAVEQAKRRGKKVVDDTASA